MRLYGYLQRMLRHPYWMFGAPPGPAAPPPRGRHCRPRTFRLLHTARDPHATQRIPAARSAGAKRPCRVPCAGRRVPACLCATRTRPPRPFRKIGLVLGPCAAERDRSSRGRPVGGRAPDMREGLCHARAESAANQLQLQPNQLQLQPNCNCTWFGCDCSSICCNRSEIELQSQRTNQLQMRPNRLIPADCARLEPDRGGSPRGPRSAAPSPEPMRSASAGPRSSGGFRLRLGRAAARIRRHRPPRRTRPKARERAPRSSGRVRRRVGWASWVGG